ncbi:hypothetical protein SNE40_001716 [Patella caerulea]|uniref:Fibrinogen C-terminal domain-containing protein n=1 Tax=Patella caerulea TaxID=87958 RepID=A0AAN8K6C5_PATCE
MVGLYSATILLVVTCLYPSNCQTPDNICQSSAYRNLPTGLQNEHQCMVLERLQRDMQNEKLTRDRQFNSILTKLSRLDIKMQAGFHRVKDMPSANRARGFPALKDITVARNCYELKMSGLNLSGVYPLKLPSGYVVNVWCDMEMQGGGWTVIQRRYDGSVNFTRGWDDYAFGFGNVNSEFWLGNENIYYMLRNTNYTLRIDLLDWEDQHAWAQYDYFKVASEENKYKLTVNGFSGTAGDSLAYHNNMFFSTMDRDHDKWYASCSNKDQSGWWFNACSYASLNGIFHPNGEQNITPDGVITGITWFEWKQNLAYSMKRVEMKIKPRVALMAEAEGLIGGYD